MNSATVARPEPTPFWSALFTDRRIALGFTSGIPFLLVYSTQSAWPSDVGISLATIGLLSELTLAYKFKFVLTVGIDGFAYALASVVLITYMSTLASTDHAASQFGLLTSLCAFPGSVLAGFSGFAIERTGFTWFFVGTSLNS